MKTIKQQVKKIIMKKQVKKITLKTDKIVALSKANAQSVVGGLGKLSCPPLCSRD